MENSEYYQYNLKQALVKPQTKPLIPEKKYFYTVTGQVVLGDNKGFSEFEKGRLVINEQIQNRIQAEGWNSPPLEEATPYFNISKPYASFPFQNLKK
jgi:hypothetical protein